MSAEEIKQMNIVFDDLSIEEGEDTQSSDRFNFVALKGNTIIGCSSGLTHKNGV